MEKKNQVPKYPLLRFPEFTDEWKKVKLGEVADRINKKNTGGVARVLTISAQYGLVEQEDFFSKRVSSVDLSNYILVKKGEFAYNKSYSHGYPWGAIKRLDQYAEGVLSPLYICFRLKDDGVDSDYLQQYFEGSQWHKEISLIAMEGARNHGLLNITIQDFFNLPLRLPSLAEQRKIAALLSLIDERIEVQNAIIKEQEAQKATLLRRLFDRTLRFPEFTDEWKEVKLGEVGEYVRGLTYGTDDVQDTGTIVIRANNLNDGCPIDFKTELVHVSIIPDPHQILRNTDITICMANGSSHLVGKASYCCDASLGTITVGAFCGIFRSTNDLARWIFQTPTYKRYIYRAIQGGNGAIANLKGDDILNQSYFLPSLPEQKKIAALLSAIDDRIAVEKEYAALLQKQKAYLLRQMFV